ncbi:MAG: cytochrome c3 family protein [Thermoanaerobaculia bacterium]
MTTRRNVHIVVLAGSFLAVSMAVASETSTCPAAKGGNAALVTVGDRTFAPAGAGLLEISVTTHCASCHDGVVASLVIPKQASLATRSMPTSDISSNHPVDISYPSFQKGFRSRSDVETTLPLVGGRITCETCHSGPEATSDRLSVSNERSRLCFVCHDK